MVVLTRRRQPLLAAALARHPGTHTFPAVSSDAARDRTEPVVLAATGPWGDVETPRPGVTASQLLRGRWHPIPDGARRQGPTVTMSGAGVA